MFKYFKLVITTIILINATIHNRCINDNHITLTFDDGPNQNTIELIKILDANNIIGTFFINGIHIIRNNMYDIVDILFKNHIIGSHGFSHASMEQLNKFNQLRELYDNEFIFRQLFKIRPYFYRPPYFSYNNEIITTIDSFGYQIITSNLNTNDWKALSSDEIYNNFVNNLINNTGIISLQHDYQTFNNEILNKMIIYALNNNFTFVPLDICIGSNIRYYKDNTYGPFLINEGI